MEYGNKRQLPPMVKESGWTVDDYFELPEDGNQYEIVNGILELKPSPTTDHQRVIRNMDHVLSDRCESHYIMILSPIDVILSERETRQPDLLMVHRSRSEIVRREGIYGPPDLVVELLSPNSVKRDRVMKLKSYARFGVPEYWIADYANQAIEQYVLTTPGEPYELLQVFTENDTVTSERLPCVKFVVKDGLQIV
ncbi:Uma2 family endonuclease [Cohnella fermenti]|uniref:Uma2 family endonuclease n=1 Tax=Cohnella fermenti TaxID=2565925 RepID=A0A4S4BQQ9_9BACL|nr:Uma2 family endonuclease [Cohnella fermenti]THF77292.1 Uma2 family endonuclease [Cohnella fermenti]